MESDSGPEVALWRAVIAQAISDATSIIRAKDPGLMKRAGLERDQARTWLLGNSKYFRDVCEMALLEPAAVREKAQALSRNGWIVRKPVKLSETLYDGEETT